MIDRCFFPTPATIVQNIIRNEVEGDYLRVLEPAVGDGALLRALDRPYERLVAVDVDENNLLKVYDVVDRDRSSLLCEDFLSYELSEEFDLILSNPPFNNRLKHFIEYKGKKVPIEAYFVLKCLDNLAVDGKAIFILPSSIVNGDKSRWIRDLIFDAYKVLSIYKLPKFSFKEVEGSFYVLCLQKSMEKGYDVRLYKSCKLSYVLNSEFLKSYGYSLDPEKLSLSGQYDEILDVVGKKSLSGFSSVNRGNLCASGIKKFVYHSTDFKSHLAIDKKIYSSQGIVGKEINPFDVIVKRVGRNVHKSFSMYVGQNPIVCSDCVVRIRPLDHSEVDSISLLLRLRVAVELGADGFFMISGSGASYISMNRLRALNIPDTEHFYDSKILRSYRKMVLASDFSGAIKLEKSIAKMLQMEFVASSKQLIDA